jgi:hypothetical protein
MAMLDMKIGLVLTAFLGGPAVAQTVPEGTAVVPALPSPDLPNSDKPSDALRAAQGSLATGQLGEAQSALEMAQTRLLDRSVPLGTTDVPSANPAVRAISEAIRRLQAGDRPGCMESIETALAAAQAEGL